MIKKFDNTYNMEKYETAEDGANVELSDCGVIQDVLNACIDRYGHKVRIRVTTVKRKT